MPQLNISAELKLKNFGKKTERAFFTVMREASADLSAYLKENLSKTGLTEQGKRRASPPYSMPYKDSGNLLNATQVIYWEFPSRAVIKAGTDISRAPYGVYLEYGTSKMLPRPYLLPNGILFFNRICSRLKNIKGVL